MYYSKFDAFVLPDGTELYPRHWKDKDVLNRTAMSTWAWEPVTSPNFSTYLQLNGRLWSDSFVAPTKGADAYVLYETPEYLAFLRNTGDRNRHYYYSIYHLEKSKAHSPCKIRKEKLKWDGQILPIPYGKYSLIWNGSLDTPVVELIKPNFLGG